MYLSIYTNVYVLKFFFFFFLAFILSFKYINFSGFYMILYHVCELVSLKICESIFCFYF